MSDTGSFQIAQGYNVIPPRSGAAYPIPCSEWDRLKSQISAIKTSFDWYHTIGSILIGAAISTLISILCGAFPSPASAPHPKIIAWAVVAVTGISGGACLYFAHECKIISSKLAREVVAQMELIESRFTGE